MIPAKTIQVLGVPIAAMRHDEALQAVEALYDLPEPALVAYANAHTLNLASRDPAYRRLLNASGLVLPDGAGVAIAARIRGTRFPANLNGSDFNPAILRLAARRQWPAYLLGARRGVAEGAAARFSEQIPDLVVAGVRDGYFAPSESSDVAATIRATGAGIVMVAMGNPLQEQWLDRHLAATGARIGVGVGAFFDFAAGVVPRAPAWMNRAGIEWTYRLWIEPRRMWRRYVLGNPLFLARVTGERFGLRARRGS